MNSIKDYLKHGFDKLFFTLISFKNQAFIAILIITTWLTYIGCLTGDNFTTIISVITPVTYFGREYAKSKFREVLNKYE